MSENTTEQESTKQDTANRKHLYLITEAEDEDKVGCIKITDSRLSRAEKNRETPYHKLDEDAGDFYIAGKQVSMGYVDFDDEDDFEENIETELKRKMSEIDGRHLEKAGHDTEEVLA